MSLLKIFFSENLLFTISGRKHQIRNNKIQMNIDLRRAKMTLGNSKQNCSWLYRTMSKFEVLKNFIKKRFITKFSEFSLLASLLIYSVSHGSATECKYQLSLTNPRDALHHGERAANK